MDGVTRPIGPLSLRGQPGQGRRVGAAVDAPGTAPWQPLRPSLKAGHWPL